MGEVLRSHNVKLLIQVYSKLAPCQTLPRVARSLVPRNLRTNPKDLFLHTTSSSGMSVQRFFPRSLTRKEKTMKKKTRRKKVAILPSRKKKIILMERRKEKKAKKVKTMVGRKREKRRKEKTRRRKARRPLETSEKGSHMERLDSKVLPRLLVNAGRNSLRKSWIFTRSAQKVI